MSDQNAKQQIIDQLKGVENVLVTVNRNPTVDELSAALGITLLINKLGKHATAVFSGDIPPAITFLEPTKTFENTVDSLRDFIIALDKEKADHLRYKVDGDMVKIFITPYRTTISERDLDFSQGDYNVEMVIAIGVQNEDDLDKALSEHGRIMHDAVVASISNGDEPGKLGTINWDDARASSYSEMVTTLAEELRTDKNLLDEQIATAFLTGIVAATERFSNGRTTSRVMTVAAELMAAGANQQLIASQLEEAGEVGPSPDESASGGAADTADASHFKVDRSEEPATQEEPAKDAETDDGTISISHEKRGDLDEVARQTLQEQQEAATVKAEEELAESLAATAGENAKPTVADLQSDLKAAADEIDESIKPSNTNDDVVLPKPESPDDQLDLPDDAPTFGGVLNATSEQAAEDTRKQELEDRNKTILSHDGAQYVGNPPVTLPPLNSYGKKDQNEDGVPSVDVLAGQAETSKAAPLQPINPIAAEPPVIPEPPAMPSSPAPAPTLAEIDEQNRDASYQDAQAAVSAALGGQSVEPAPAPLQSGDGLPPLPPMPDFSTLPPLSTAPDGVSLPPAPASPEDILSSALEQPAAPLAPAPESAPDPNQFRIPGQ